MKEIYLYHTYRKEKVLLKPINPPIVTMYSCGPTVYDIPTLGNWRSFVFSDLLYRTLKYFGYTVKKVMNYTDVGHLTNDNFGDADTGEDRIEKGAKKYNVSVEELILKMIKKFNEDAIKLNILMDEIITCRATNHIQDMIDMIKKLESKGYTYTTRQAVYFDITKFPEIEKYTQQKLSDMVVDASNRVSKEKDSKHPLDFRLWQLNQKDHIQQWDSPWGRGFPGWHIECSAMACHYLGETIDIHTGGEDHIKLHHANEIAQSKCANDKEFANIWMHNAFMMVDNKRMGKSMGNAYILDDVINKGFSPLDLRFWYYTSHYRTKTNFTWDLLNDAKKQRKYINNLIQRIKKEINNIDNIFYDKQKYSYLSGKINDVENALTDDLNTPLVLSILYELSAYINNILDNKNYDIEEVAYFYNFLKNINNVLGFLEFDEINFDIPQEVKKLAEMRLNFKKEKKFQQADDLRKKIFEMGYNIKDTKEGYEIEKIL